MDTLRTLSKSQLVLTSILAPVLYAVVKVIYNLYFHPLCSYPGPLLGRATRLYSIFWDLHGTSHLKVQAWHDKYGEVFRVSPNQLSYNSGRAWDKICGHRTASNPRLFDKYEKFFLKSPDGVHNIIGANGEEHRRLRRLMAHGFSDKALKDQEDILLNYVDFFITQLHKHASQANGVVNMMHWFNYITFDIIGDLAFGDSFGLLEKGTWQRYVSSVLGLLQYGLRLRTVKVLSPEPLVKIISAIITPKQMMIDRLYQYDLAKSKIARRVAVDTERHDFVHYMLKGSDKSSGTDSLSFNEMVSMGEILIIAGSETTATALSGMLYNLLRKPAALSRLTEEIRNHFKNENEININSTSQLRYLHAVLEESMRIYPPVPTTLPRVAPEPGQVICDRFVPAGTVVGLHHYSCYHSEQNFFEPYSFHPERWLAGDDPRFAGDQKDAFRPFSHGPRNCLGKNLAYAELRLITCKIFWNFDMELQPESLDWADQNTTALWIKKPLMVKLIPRVRRD